MVRICKVEGQFGTRVYVPLAEDDNCEPWTRFDPIHCQYPHCYTRLRHVLWRMSDGGLDILGCKVTSVCIWISTEIKNPSHSAGVACWDSRGISLPQLRQLWPGARGMGSSNTTFITMVVPASHPSSPLLSCLTSFPDSIHRSKRLALIHFIRNLV